MKLLSTPWIAKSYSPKTCKRVSSKGGWLLRKTYYNRDKTSCSQTYSQIYFISRLHATTRGRQSLFNVQYVLSKLWKGNDFIQCGSDHTATWWPDRNKYQCNASFSVLEVTIKPLFDTDNTAIPQITPSQSFAIVSQPLLMLNSRLHC